MRGKLERKEARRPRANLLLPALKSPYPLPHLAPTRSGIWPELLETNFTENARRITSVWKEDEPHPRRQKEYSMSEQK